MAQQDRQDGAHAEHQTEFDCAAEADKLKEQEYLKYLNYDSMKLSLFAKDVIANNERKIIDAKIGEEKMMYLIADIIIPSLKLKNCKKYKGFLKAMEDSDDSYLQITAEMLGGSERVPANTTQNNHPTLSQLKDVMRNETNIIIHWYDIGLELLDDGILDLIKDGASGNAEKCCTRMFKTWLDRNPDASWNQLIGTLKKIKLNAAAESVKSYSGSKRVPEDITQSGSKRVPEDITQRSFKELYSQAISDLGSEDLQLCKVVFFGPPGVGKSSLLRVLLKLPESERESTGVFDLKLVQFKVEVTKDDKECRSTWNIITLKNEIKRLRHIIEEKLNKHEIHKSDPDEWQQKPSLENISLPNVEGNKNIHEVVCQSLPDIPTKEQRISKTSNIMIALYDSGGQPEFFDVMPLLNTLPTGNVMIFNMNKMLDAKISPELYEKGHCVSTGKETHYTNAELMKTALANIESCVREQISSTSNNVLVVGTHFDEYVMDKENVEESLSQLDDTLNKTVLTKSTRSLIVYNKRKSGENRIVHPISNTKQSEEQDEVAQKLRTAIENMSESANTLKKIPTSWLLFQYQIRLLEKPCISLSDCQDIAEKVCYMKEDVKVVLKYFHDLGILLNYKELDDVVFCDPQWLFEQLSILIKSKYNDTFRADIENGIVSTKFLAKNIYSSIEKDTDNVIKLNDLLKLFVSLNIMAKLPSINELEERYFMPALLDPAPQNLSLSVFGKKFYDTMYIMYKGTLFPRGMFCCLATLLTQNQRNFTIMDSKLYMYKNLIVFQDENENYLILSDKINYITVDVYQQELQYQKCNLLQKIHSEIIQVLHKASEKMKVNFQFEFGFACQEKSCQEKNSKENTTAIAVVKIEHSICPKSMQCKSCSKSVPLSFYQLLWFLPLKVLNLVTTEHSKQSHAKRKHDMDKPSDIESDSGAKSKKPKKEELSDPLEHHYKMTHMEVYQKYIDKLVKALPMDDVTFTTQLSSNGILPDSVGAHIKSLPTSSDKADYFLKSVVKSSLDIDDTEELNNLITVMDKCRYRHIERLGNKMKLDLR